MDTDKQLNNADKTDTEYVKMYFEHQYDRFAKLELLAFTFTSIAVIPLSGVLLTFGYNQIGVISRAQNSIVLLFIIVLNIFAILYLVHTSRQGQSHRRRAKKILKKYAPVLAEIDKDFAFGLDEQKSGLLVNLLRYSQWTIYLLLYMAFIFIAIWLWYGQSSTHKPFPLVTRYEQNFLTFVNNSIHKI